MVKSGLTPRQNEEGGKHVVNEELSHRADGEYK